MVVAIGVIAVLGVAIHGQRSGGRQEVQLPWLGMTLKAGWQVRFYDGCRFAVPLTWQVTPGSRQVFAPDGSSLLIWSRQVPSWSLHRSQATAAFGPVSTVHENDDRRLWIEAGDDIRIRHYIATVAGSVACNGLLEIRASMKNPEETAQTIADSIGAAPAEWPADLK